MSNSFQNVVKTLSDFDQFRDYPLPLSLFPGTSQIFVINTHSTFEVTYLPGIEPSSFVPAVPHSIRYTTGDATEIRPSRRHAATAPVHSFSSCTPLPSPHFLLLPAHAHYAPPLTICRVCFERLLLHQADLVF